MNCPCCGNEMKSGFLASGKPILWTREKDDIVILPGEEGFRVSSGFWTGCYAESHFCPACNILITPVSKSSKKES